ncbi:MAG: P1 family peptidase [Chloroflexota bacterium]|nr:P1 family peptidase [Chloroflexota bacterium]
MVVIEGPLEDMIGVSIGHWTDAHARTGCTVIAFDEPALTAVEVRGAAPGTRELDALAPGRLEQQANAIVLTGGSAFGLRAADGVAQELADRGIGYATSAGPVPIVPAAVIFDLSFGDPVAPGADKGLAALRAAVPLSQVSQGVAGAGTGARWNKLGGTVRQGGLGIAQARLDDHLVAAVVVLNAMGAVRNEDPDPRSAFLAGSPSPAARGEATTLISVITSAPCNHGILTRMCVSAHDALARMVIPAHTVYDGDVAFASTLGPGNLSPRETLRLTLAVELVVEAAIVRAALPVMESGATLKKRFVTARPDSGATR